MTSGPLLTWLQCFPTLLLHSGHSGLLAGRPQPPHRTPGMFYPRIHIVLPPQAAPFPQLPPDLPQTPSLTTPGICLKAEFSGRPPLTPFRLPQFIFLLALAAHGEGGRSGPRPQILGLVSVSPAWDGRSEELEPEALFAVLSVPTCIRDSSWEVLGVELIAVE